LLRAEGKPGTNLPAWMMKNRRKSRRIAFSTRSRQAERPARPAAQVRRAPSGGAGATQTRGETQSAASG
jgi:hypothetical protein